MISNFRFFLLSLSFLVGVAAPWHFNAQASIISTGSASSIKERVSTLEQISNAQAQLLQLLQQQINDNQSDIDSLRGQIQNNSHQLNQVIERQKHLYQQFDNLSSKADNAIQSSSDTAASASPMQNGDANSDYTAAVSMIIEKKQYDQAIIALQAWVKRYPDSIYQPNANYWLGQLNYNKGKKDDAVYYYATVVKNYPKSQKASESLLKVGILMQEEKNKGKAKAVYQEVIKLYPNTTSAKLAQKRLTGL
ncbi:tol-pal system protein YbgF [Pantoea sp. Nvir]|uniref:tol-pal system protein YbgF n=1 Tax=Pantoea sp. Nvir TaxID=2576760 RepID=UPI00135C0D53|nr:tol-pal system protein YbgF [Pantoea sp. Nvir]MXP66318.1 tol-pal system protein YbgF [Pantoea sp. Nvir]CAJ0992944.1 Cell division coordinator CpoB [Pantoea sp. Nvir]